jgi:hypothetical protein
LILIVKPKLFLDVDGPLNPYAAKPTRRPEGYLTYRYFNGQWIEGRHGMRVWLNPAHGPMLLALGGLVDLWWLTSWMELANTLIAPKIGLPELPVLDFTPKRYNRPWTADVVDEFVPGEPFAWFDDDFTKVDLEWGKQRTKKTPTLLVRVDPRIGLRQEDADWVEDWASR